MLLLGTFDEATDKVWADTQALIEQVRTLCADSVHDVTDAIALLMRLREETAEDINQIQHEHLILLAVEWLTAHHICTPDAVWHWNPRQTGGVDEPDLRGSDSRGIIVSAEVTTSLLPQGVIDGRMAETLRKLSAMDGALYYFVRSAAMAARAQTKVRKAGYQISVVNVST